MSSNIPRRLSKRPTFRGLPIPYTTLIGKDGQPDFKVNDEYKKLDCLKDRLCALCGEAHEPLVAFIGGESCIKHRLFTDAPMHRECAEYAAKVCPYLANSGRQFSSASPKHAEEQGYFVDPLNSGLRPKRMGMMLTKGYEFGRIKGQGPTIYIRAGKPISIDWSIMPETPEPPPKPKLWQPGDPLTNAEKKAAGIKTTRIGISIDELPTLTEALKNGEGIRWHNEKETPEGRIPDAHDIEHINSDYLVKLSDDPTLFHVIAHVGRTGAHAYIQSLEQYWFTPGTPLNDEYQFCVYRWTELLWMIVSVPLEKKHVCFEQAKSCRMRLADGVPTAIGNPPPYFGKHKDIGGVVMNQFPLCSDNACNLEHSEDSAVYQGPGGEQDEEVRETFDLEQLRKQHGSRRD